LRALAAWAWRRQDSECLEVIRPYFTSLNGLLEQPSQDHGPVGFTLAYLHLCQRNGATLPGELPEWVLVEQALEADHYWLELAIFQHLLAVPVTRIEKSLDRFQDERLHAPADQHWPAWLSTADLRGVMATRDAQARERLCVNPPGAWETLVAAGLLPL